ncbi:MAG: glycerol kinase GlpK [Leptospiraceae bacterium]|nr:glycerol kinase GlpK [Leptospiraceae bacterium]
MAKDKSSGKEFVISIDQGTTGSRVFCFNKKGQVIASEYREFTQHFPRPGWVEHDAEEIWKGVTVLLKKALKKGKLKAKDCVGIGITNQRETTVVWDRNTGKPIHNAIVWQCRRTAARCEELKKQGHEELVRSRTGLVIDAYFSGTKIEWILNQVSGARDRAAKGELCAGTIDAWLLFKLTDGAAFATDYTNASRTMLYNIEKKEWDSELLAMLNIPTAILPEVKDSRAPYGTTRNVPDFADGVPVLALIGDQQAALFGQLRVNPGEAKNTYGTGCFLLFNTGDEFLISRSGLITTLACNDQGRVCYALEGAVFIGGAVVQWLRDYMQFFNDAAKSEKMAIKAEGADDVVFVPAFVGLGAPHWNQNARGAIFGLSRDTSPASITRAALKSIAMQSYELVTAMEADTGKKMDLLRVDGGATANDFLLQFQADILGTAVERPANVDTTALGSAYLAGLEAGFWQDVNELLQLQSDTTTFQPKMEDDRRQREIRFWKKAVERAKDWAED